MDHESWGTKITYSNISNSKNLHLKNPNRQSHRNNQKFIELILDCKLPENPISMQSKDRMNHDE